MNTDKQLSFEELTQLAAASAAVTQDCTCAIDSFREWTRIPAAFPEQQVRAVGTLVEDPYAEASYDEYHPDKTNYWSAAAPVAWEWFRLSIRSGRSPGPLRPRSVPTSRSWGLG